MSNSDNQVIKLSTFELKIKFTPIPIFALKMMGEHTMRS